MKVVALDTTSEYGSLALVDDGRLIEEIALHSPDGFAHVIFGEIREMLGRHSLNVSDIGGWAAAAGPGSFTGVRVGLAAVKGLAAAMGVNAAGISNLEALAAFGSAELRAVWIDAHRGEIYGAVYNSALAIVQPEIVGPFDTWRAGLPKDVEIIAGGNRPLAGAIGRLAIPRLGNPAMLDANYVRRSDAELKWRD